MKYVCVCKCEIVVDAEDSDAAEDIVYECIEGGIHECEVEDCYCDCEPK